jgi:hypothetical protein
MVAVEVAVKAVTAVQEVTAVQVEPEDKENIVLLLYTYMVDTQLLGVVVQVKLTLYKTLTRGLVLLTSVTVVVLVSMVVLNQHGIGTVIDGTILTVVLEDLAVAAVAAEVPVETVEEVKDITKVDIMVLVVLVDQ